MLVPSFRFCSGHERREEHDKGKPSAGSSATSVKRKPWTAAVGAPRVHFTTSYELLLAVVLHGSHHPFYLPDDS